MIKIIIIDNLTISRKCLAQVLRTDLVFYVYEEYDKISEARKKIRNKKKLIIIINIGFILSFNHETLIDILKLKIPILILYDDEMELVTNNEYIKCKIRIIKSIYSLGVSGVINSNNSVSDIKLALTTIFKTRKYIDEELAIELFQFRISKKYT